MKTIFSECSYFIFAKTDQQQYDAYENGQYPQYAMDENGNYLMDENGNYIPLEVQYMTDEHGNYVQDENGWKNNSSTIFSKYSEMHNFDKIKNLKIYWNV